MGAATHNIDFFARIGEPRRLTAGLLTVTVRNNHPTLDDLFEHYYSNWGGGAGNSESSDHFNGTNPSSAGLDPLRTGYALSAGDNDTMLFFVTVDGVLQTHQTNGTQFPTTTVKSVIDSSNIDVFETLPTIGADGFDLDGMSISRYNSSDVLQETGTVRSNDVGSIETNGITWSAGTDKYVLDDWYTSIPTHRKCQSFVRYSLLSRHNNAYGHNENTVSEHFNYIGQSQQKYVPGASTSKETTLDVDRMLVNDSIFSTSNFGATGDDNSTDINLDTKTRNNYWNPVRNVDIFGKHDLTYYTSDFGGATTYYALDTHDTDFYNLVVRVNLFAFTDTVTKSFFKNLINVQWQPFGETANLQFDTSEFTS